MKTQKGSVEVFSLIMMILIAVAALIVISKASTELEIRKILILRHINKCEIVGQIKNTTDALWKCPTLDKVYATSDLNLDDNGLVIIEKAE